MSDLTLTATALESTPMGTFDESGEYVPRPITENDLGTLTLEEAYSATMVDVENGQLVEGTVVRVDKDEVLLDIGYKSEGVIPPRELSIRNGVDPSDVVSVGEKIEAVVLQREDRDGRLVLSKKRAQYERAWGRIEEIKEGDGIVSGSVIEVVKGGLIVDIGLRGFLPASLVDL
ncbi:MAG: S1 RNA-binding domain-containing protein, partial [Acidimicrobiales bacterium]|nr:S1 RNA-binding domain-containing protein [Acidimicrobiales bacterium]